MIGSGGKGIFSGAMNTALIVARQVEDQVSGNFAAKHCANFSVTVDSVTYGGWHLPSIEELELLYKAGGHLSGTSNAYYWSSTEVDQDNAWFFNANQGIRSTENKGVGMLWARPIRSF